MLSPTYKYQGFYETVFANKINVTTYLPFNNKELPPPAAFLPIKFIFDTNYIFKFGTNSNSFTLMFTPSFNPINTIPGVFISTTSNSVSIVLGADAPLTFGSYEINDRYFISFSDTVLFTAGRVGSFTLHSNSTLNLNLSKNVINLVQVPIVNINAQTTIDSEYLSDVTFTIKDKYYYYKHLKLKCKNSYMNEKELKTTTFLQYGIPMQNVVKGIGVTLQDKILLIYYQCKPLISFQMFYENMILYGMLKYLLSYILYGDFNIEYLLNKYNDQFFKKLKKSRFCGAVQFFIDNHIDHYNIYFN